MIATLLSLAMASAEPIQDRQVLAAVRALAYDRKLAERAGPTIELVVVYGGPATRADAARIGVVLTGLGQFTIQNVPVTVVVVDGARVLDHTVPADVLLLPAGLGTAADPLVKEAAAQGLLVAGFDVDYLARGAALVVVTNGDQLRLVVDLPVARAAGAAFGSQLLQLAELYP